MLRVERKGKAFITRMVSRAGFLSFALSNLTYLELFAGFRPSTLASFFCESVDYRPNTVNPFDII